ncbi:MAG TPA: cytidine deaminase [Bacteroidales bacterium]|nr:cytidine deaminase [Bacteroidales bacterium]HPT01716.1 cytidine deaminase [Bacteroidales bacterium]
MNERLISISYTEFNHIGEMAGTDQILLKKAIEAVHSSYAPYSAFHVGAAVRLEGGDIYTGSNQENSAYPSGICAERVAIFTASSQHPGETIETIAIAAHTDSFELCDPVTPCGSCRQVMAEYQNLSGKPIRVIMKGMSERIWMVEGVENLLPLMFHDDKLKK